MHSCLEIMSLTQEQRDLRPVLRSREELDRLVASFDELTLAVLALTGDQAVPLPDWLRLTDYFIANCGADD